MRIVRNLALTAAFALTCLSALGTARADCAVNPVKNKDGTVYYAPMCANVTVETMYLNSSALNLKTSGNESIIAKDANGCKLGDDAYLKLPVSNPLFDSYLSMLLAAKLSGKTVNVRVADNKDGVCEVAYIVFN